MTHSRARLLLLGLVLSINCGIFGLWSLRNTREPTLEQLKSDYIRIGNTNNFWRASKPERLLHYLRHWGQVYSCAITSQTPLTNLVQSYSIFAARPVYVQREMSSFMIGPVTVSAYTHEGLVTGLERVLRTNGISPTRMRNGSILLTAAHDRHADGPTSGLSQ
jgi:hypothetical protein